MDYVNECKQALAIVRAYCRKHAPYMSSIIYGLVPYFVPGIKTLAVTDRMVLFLDPEWFVTMPVEVEELPSKRDTERVEEYARLRMQAGCIMHECNHIIRGMDRLDRMPDKDLANIAFDLPINSDLEKVVHEDPITKKSVRTWDLPRWVYYPRKFGLPEGLTGEQYYEILEKHQKDIASSGNSPGGSGSNDGGGSRAKKSRIKLPPKEQRNIGAGRCGSCAGGVVDPALEKAVNEAVGRTPADKERIRSNAIHDIRKELESSGGIGTMPESFRSLLSNEDKPQRLVPWRLRLSRVCRRATGRMKAGRSDYSLARPSKRSLLSNVVRPGLIDREINILFIEDSSGSMFIAGASPLKQVRVEVSSVMQQLGIDQAWFMDADADVAAPPRLIRMRDIERLPVHGGGGTNFAPALERAQKLKPRPDIVIYLTDGAGYAPKHPPPNMEVVWCVVPSPYGTKPCNWGHLIVCSDDRELREPYGV